jgi:hypothetical protein
MEQTWKALIAFDAARLGGRRVEDLAFAQGRGPDPAATDNTANFASTAVLEDPLQQ